MFSKEDKGVNDNGAEFSGTTRHYERNYFTQAVEKHRAAHQYIHPGHCNANADVESIHHTIEEEFYNLTQFSSREDFLKKAKSYRHFYNLADPTFPKRGKHHGKHPKRTTLIATLQL